MKNAIMIVEDQKMDALGLLVVESEDFNNITLTQIKDIRSKDEYQSLLIHKGMPLQAKENEYPAFIELEGTTNAFYIYLGFIRLQFFYYGKRDVYTIAEEMMMAICAIVYGE